MAGAMIEFLKISSMAIFDEVEIEFGQGLNCITGETGAGKSLVLGALMLLMGSKASQDLVRPGAQKASIEALFTISGREMVIRREIYPTGSSRCYVDGKLATAAGLAEISSSLITIYGQHEYQDLLNPAQQMSILESLAQLDRNHVHLAYETLSDAVKHLHSLESTIEEYRKERENLLFALEELLSVDLTPGLEDELTAELSLAQGAAELKQCAHLAEETLYSGASSVVELLGRTREYMSKAASVDRSIVPLAQSLDELSASIEDISIALREKAAAYEYDPEQIAALEEKLHFVQDLKRKHKTDEQGLLALKKETENRLALTEDSDQAISQARNAVSEAIRKYREHIRAFLEQRMAFSRAFCRRINNALHELGMPGAEFQVVQPEITSLDDLMLDAKGCPVSPGVLLKGEFLISTNVGHKPLPLARIASGGELSRIMLAIKVQQKSSQEGTLLFDEIDSGISGQTALMIARRLKELSGHAQSIVVTHLHQVASVADSHFVITKHAEDGRTISTIREIHDMDRAMELARMMGGEAPSPAVIRHAKELIGL
jgi:DNA repair protein RecN (Recombination protein N)